MIRRPPRSTLFPNTPLFGSKACGVEKKPAAAARTHESRHPGLDDGEIDAAGVVPLGCQVIPFDNVVSLDVREQIRSEEHTSESSHLVISYAVFCLKKKK